MSFGTYFKERIGFLLSNGLLFLLVCSVVLLLDGSGLICLFIFLIWFGPMITYMLKEWLKYKKYYDHMASVLENLEPKYLLPEVIGEPPFSEATVIYDVLKVTTKEMHEQVKGYEVLQQEYKEYIESWIHEIKTPIASANLIIENNEGPVTYKIAEEIRQIEGFVEQALYYARSTEVSKDYIVKPMKLRTIVLGVIKDNSRALIQKKIVPQLGALEEVVYSDSKWVSFIINQLISNSIKYSKETGSILKISSEVHKNKVILSIEDQGIGIDEKDVRRVFDKGFTGENGRRFSRATGIGLYLCKRLCDKLGLGIGLESKKGEGTRVKLIFPLGEMMQIR